MLRIRLPLGWGVLGLGLLALGTGLGWLYLGLVREIDDMVRSTVAQFMGTLPFFVGAGILAFRRGCDIDRANGRVVKWWGVLWPMSRREFALDLFDQVSLRQEPRVSGSKRRPRTATVYPVRLEGEKRLDLRVEQAAEQAQALAAAVAEYLDLPLVSTVHHDGREERADD